MGLITAAPGAQAKEIPSPWTWTDYGLTLRDVSCSSPGVCVAVGQRGMALRSAGTALAWSKVDVGIKPPDELTGVACTPAFCLSVSNRRPSATSVVSKIYRSTDHGRTWPESVALPPAGTVKTRSALAVACDPDAGACYAVGPAGGIWRSTDQGMEWKALTLPSTPGNETYRRVACPDDETCVAVGGKSLASAVIIKGENVTSVKPKMSGLTALACDRPTRCTATNGTQFVSLNIPEKRWGNPEPFGEGISAVSALACPVEDTCVGVQLKEPDAVFTNSLSSGDWKPRPIGSPNLEAITCVRTDCVAAGKAAAWFASSDGGFDWGRVNEVGRFGPIQCSVAFSPTCVAGGEKDLGVSRSGGKLWSLPLSGVTGLNIKSVNCTGPSECLLLGKTRTLFTTDLQAFPSRWPSTTDPAGTDALTCITKDLCVGITDGLVYTTLDGGLTPWTHNGFASDHPASVACLPGRTNPVTCVAAGRKFVILLTMTESGGQISWNWRYTDGYSSKGLEAIACSPGGECTAVGPDGVVLTSDGADLVRWTKHVIPEDVPPEQRPLLKSVTCPADGVCLAGGVHSPDAIIASTTNDWVDYSYDKIAGIETEGPMILGFGCKTVNRCVAVGDTVLIGKRK